MRYAGISQWHHNIPGVMCQAGFPFVCHAISPHDVTLSIHRWCQAPSCWGNRRMYTLRSRAKMHSDPDHDSFPLITRYCFTLRKELVSPNSYLCIYNKKCNLAIENCCQANGNNSHLVPGVPTGLGRDIRDMSIACRRTHPDANNHVWHISMYQPVYSAHANKCCLKTCPILGLKRN